MEELDFYVTKEEKKTVDSNGDTEKEKDEQKNLNGH